MRCLSGSACEHGPRGTDCCQCYKAGHGGAHICEHLLRRRACRTCRPLVDASRQRLISWVQFLANGAALQVRPQDQANPPIQLVPRALSLMQATAATSLSNLAPCVVVSGALIEFRSILHTVQPRVRLNHLCVLRPSLSLTAKILATKPVLTGTRTGMGSGPVTRSMANRSSFALNSPFRSKTRRKPVKHTSLAKTARCISAVAAAACISITVFR